MFVNFLDVIMVNVYIIYEENFKIMNMLGLQNYIQLFEYDKFLFGVIYKLIGNFFCCCLFGLVLVLFFFFFYGRDYDFVNVF